MELENVQSAQDDGFVDFFRGGVDEYADPCHVPGQTAADDTRLRGSYRPRAARIENKPESVGTGGYRRFCIRCIGNPADFDRYRHTEEFNGTRPSSSGISDPSGHRPCVAQKNGQAFQPGRRWKNGRYSSLPPLPEVSPTLFIIEIRGMNIAITILPTTTARNTIMIGSNREVMAATALSTSSS